MVVEYLPIIKHYAEFYTETQNMRVNAVHRLEQGETKTTVSFEQTFSNSREDTCKTLSESTEFSQAIIIPLRKIRAGLKPAPAILLV